MTNIFRESVNGIELIPIDDELLDHRAIFLVDAVNAATSNQLIMQLMYLEAQEEKSEITLYINSPGGDVTSGLAVYDYIGTMKSPLKTVCIGQASSMAAILFLAGEKREMLEHTEIMIHDPSYGNFNMSSKKPHEIQERLDSLNKTREKLARIIADRTGKSLEEIYEITADDTYFDAEQAIEFGLATGIFKGGKQQ